MDQDNKPIVIVSKCLGFEHCRWNGEIVNDEFVEGLAAHVVFHPVCPEKEIGLGVPRDPIRIVSSRGVASLVQPATGRDVTSEMLDFCEGFMASTGTVDGFLLKSRSPSCGPGDVKIYPAGGKSGAMDKGPGFFGGAVLAAFPDLAIESDGRLKNFRIREHYLTRLFTISRFRAIQKSAAMRDLVDFHARNKLLLMAYNQSELKVLGKIVANHEHRQVEELIPLYRDHLARALLRSPRYTSNINVLMHALGYFSREITPREKGYFLEALERYRAGNIPLSAVSSIVNSWIVRFNQAYLQQQSFFQPYPEELAFISDSGKGRDL
ncbi:MAG: DUF1722 domain-containing protein [Actinobacteria bacterium]|jgi:uncharacterized protein YbgA (DUF1722 family)/uncharacterized protein YbbK (DUF523 family)|nr:MAG: DUF1722 domain-containing protein [Actinomycetota bacterium]